MQLFCMQFIPFQHAIRTWQQVHRGINYSWKAFVSRLACLAKERKSENMRKGNSRLFVCSTLVLCLISISFSALADCPNVPGHGDTYKAPLRKESLGYEYVNPNLHIENIRQVWYCTACGSTKGSWVTFIAPGESHGVAYYRDDGHVSGKNSHNWRVICNKCNYVRTKAYVCYGPPCAHPF